VQTFRGKPIFSLGVQTKKVVTCFVCSRVAVGEAIHDCGKHVLVCKKHLEELRVHPKWRVSKGG